MNHTTIHPLCASQAHLIDIHLWRGAPENTNPNNPIQILVNHGYVVGYSPATLQPAWSAYRVAFASKDVDYERDLYYYDDMRLSDELRIGRKTFGKIGGIQLNVGHMTPNEVINRQYGRLAQMETFMMSNMSPQYGSLNSGVWLKLENALREVQDTSQNDHVFVIVGPIFGEEPQSISRGNGKNLPVPSSYFCIAVQPNGYPFDTLSSAKIDCFIIPQDAPRSSFPDDYPSSIEEIENATKLKFFAGFSRQTPLASTNQQEEGTESQLMQALRKDREKFVAQQTDFEKARNASKTIDELIEVLKSEAAHIQVQARALSELEISRLQTIQHTISFLIQAQSFSPTKKGISTTKKDAVAPVNLITYKIVSDSGNKLKKASRVACNFWNRFIIPQYSIVIRLGTFTQSGNTIARAYMPFEKDGVRYGDVEFNTKFLSDFSSDEIAGTIIHEIGHTLGIGWNEWTNLFNHSTGVFKKDAIKRLEKLSQMRVELDGGSGTALAHWDEEKFDKELMTGYKNTGEHVLPVTIDVMEVLGHQVIERITTTTLLSDLLRQAASTIFSRQEEVRAIDLDYYERTELMETIPHS
ncbi:MAG: hypothetical protein RLZZ262_2434 [Bacteroidota bacterium]|jgi:DNA/RNA endonuclease G (NUC1)